MQVRILFVLLLVIPALGKAQNASSANWVSPLFSVKKEPLQDLLLVDDGKLYVVGEKGGTLITESKGKDVHFRVYDNNSLSLLKEVVLEGFNYEGAKAIYKKAFSNETGFHLFFECSDKVKGVRYLLHCQIDREGIATEPSLIAVAPSKDSKFTYHFSEDKSYTLINVEVKKEAGVARSLEVIMYNENFELQWKDTLVSPFPTNYFTVSQLAVSRQGELFALGSASDSKIAMRDDKITMDYAVIRMYKEDEPVSYTFSSLEMTIHDAWVKPDYNGNLLILGYFSDDKESRAASSFLGLYSQQSLEQKKLKKKKYGREDFLALNNDSRSEANKGVTQLITGVYQGSFDGFEHFRFKDFVPLPDGGFMAISERQYHTHDVQDYNGGVTFNYFDEIAITAFDAMGAMQWISIIPKKQAPYYELTASYYFHETAAALYLFFNDDPRNLERRNTGEPIKKIGGQAYVLPVATIAAKVDHQGNVSYERIGDLEGSRDWFSPGHAFSLDDNNVVFLLFDPLYYHYKFVQHKFP